MLHNSLPRLYLSYIQFRTRENQSWGMEGCRRAPAGPAEHWECVTESTLDFPCIGSVTSSDIRVTLTRPSLGHRKGLFVSIAADSSSLSDKDDHFLLVELFFSTGSKDECLQIQLFKKNSSFACLLSFHPFVPWSANPDHCFVPSRFYHWEEPIRLWVSASLLEPTGSCSLVSTFCATWAPHGQVLLFFPSQLYYGNRYLGKTG